MKWILVTLVLIFAGWFAAVSFFNEDKSATGDGLNASLSVIDSAGAKAMMPGDLSIDSVKAGSNNTPIKRDLHLPAGNIDTKGAKPADVVAFAKTLVGVPYLYGSTEPSTGFDCSGFITYVFRHFDIVVPRSSIDFTNVGTEVSTAKAREGDLILFTGTDSSERFVGHMGIVVANTDTLRFIHSTSGKAHGVTITPLGQYYQGRYVKTIRIFP